MALKQINKLKNTSIVGPFTFDMKYAMDIRIGSIGTEIVIKIDIIKVENTVVVMTFSLTFTENLSTQ